MFSRRDDDDHLYDFNAGPSTLAAPGTAMGGAGKPMTAYRGAGAPLQSSAGRMGPFGNAIPGSRAGLTTGMAGAGGGEARPMTSVSGVPNIILFSTSFAT